MTKLKNIHSQNRSPCTVFCTSMWENARSRTSRYPQTHLHGLSSFPSSNIEYAALKKLSLLCSFGTARATATVLNPRPPHLKYSELCPIFYDLSAPNLCAVIQGLGEGRRASLGAFLGAGIALTSGQNCLPCNVGLKFETLDPAAIAGPFLHLKGSISCRITQSIKDPFAFGSAKKKLKRPSSKC